MFIDFLHRFVIDHINSLATPPPIAYKYNKNKNLIFWYKPLELPTDFTLYFRTLFHFFHKKLFLMFIKTSKYIHSYLSHNSPLDRTHFRLLNYDKKDACITLYGKPIP